MSFSELGLDPRILQALEQEGYTTPTPIQRDAIPHAMAGRDILGIAQTGTGKTAAFGLPLLHLLAESKGRPPRGGCRALILSPTRELASQIADNLKIYGRHLGLTVSVIFGGVPHGAQRRALANGIDILVATPGRLQDHLDEGSARLDMVNALVLDEADQMLDKGFWPAIRRILPKLPAKRHTMFFSATMPAEVAKLSAEILRDPVRIEVAPVATTAERVAQKLIVIEQGRKRGKLAELLKGEGVGRVLVFTRTKHGADRVVKNLEADGIAANAIHGNKSQGQRERALSDFKSNRAPVLVATDIAARGIDVDGVTHVIQHDMPDTPEAYVHRIGRTARAGASGIAIAMCAPDEREKLWAVEKLIRISIPATDERQDVSVPMHRTGGRPDAVKPSGGNRGRNSPSRGRNGGGGGQGRGGQAQGAPRGAAPSAPRGGDQPVRRPAAAAAGQKDRSWREGDFRDGAARGR
ncbi:MULTISPECIES: DEAD/DEAH box helicase [Roseomonadaceae]|jgi:ATP-dependent RNA helicase RhlE|uniref:DEAD/DEAH box helicase n=1 Tax=Falsiroseomonas oleicola TaxID=2801474 RepID=A0ABS6H8Z4_9PROT|nr:DEAD/DEAH box helicase [Roseomonas oleicola]MBU8544919.1 DEAD/DEAH box helicase [Roseomonas oleicola]